MYPQSMFLTKKEKYQLFSSKNIIFYHLQKFLHNAWACLGTVSGFALDFQHFPSDLVNVNYNYHN